MTSGPGNEAGISVVIPVHNEEEGLASVLAELHAVLEKSPFPYEVLVVDDGSEDDSAGVAGRNGARLVRLSSNRGYGAALKVGIRNARHSTICICDGDGTYPAAAIPGLVRALREDDLDMVVGARIGSKVAIPWVRRPASWILRRLASIMSRASIPDLNSGLRVFHRDVATSFYRLLSDQFSFTTTLTLAMETNGYRVAYVPIDYRSRVGRSKIRPISDTLHFLQLILRMTLYFSPMRIFLPAAGILLLGATAWACFTLFVWRRLADLSTLVLVMAALQMGAVGLLAELLNQRLPNPHSRD